MKGQNIICFAKDWSEDPTSNNHVMECLAENNKVLWLNSIALRTPDLSSRRDVKKIISKLADFFKGYKQVRKNMWVYTPIVLPFPHNSIATFLNRYILKVTVKILRLALGMREYQLWTFLPTMSEYAGSLGESFLVYYCTDEHGQFSYLDTRKIIEKEKDLIKKADVVFVTANLLLDRKKKFNPESHLADHGVGYDHFAMALEEKTQIPDDVKSLEQPILGFFGLIHDWIDLELITYLAVRHPDWSIVMVGQSNVDLSELNKLTNVHLLGRKDYRELPGYCKAFSVGLIPFKINELTVHVNPIKLKEYLSAGLPVVSTPLPEVEFYSNLCTIAEKKEEFLVACEKSVIETTFKSKKKLSEQMKEETWQAKVEKLGEHITRIQGQ